MIREKANFYQSYNNIAENPIDPTIGWWYTWNTSPNKWAFGAAEEQALLPNSHYWPIWAWPDDNPRSDGQNPEILASAESYFGWWNEPYGENQANITPTASLDLWERLLINYHLSC